MVPVDGYFLDESSQWLETGSLSRRRLLNRHRSLTVLLCSDVEEA